MLQGYHEVVTPNDIVFGNCFHDFVAEYRRNGQEFNKALTKGWEFRTTVPRIFTKFRKDYLNDFAYFKQVCFLWSMEHSSWKTVEIGGKPCAELGWLIPFYTGEHVDISLCGTIDDICVHRDNPGAVAIRDYKTTSATDAQDYFGKYRLSSQLITYYYGLSRSCERARLAKPDSELAAIWLDAQSRHVFIEGLFLNPDPFKVKFQTSDAFEIDPNRVVEYESLVLDLCRRLDRPADHVFLPEGLVTRACESEGYGRKCSFFEVCAANSKEDSAMMLQSMFAKDEEYNPLLA